MNKVRAQYEKFLLLNNFSIKKVKIIKCLIHLNMSPLHEYPFDKLLFSHSKLELFKILKKYDIFITLILPIIKNITDKI